MSKFDKIKMQNFVSENAEFFRKIGGRGETRYQSAKLICKTADKKAGSYSRYEMVNISPSNTIEYRYPISKLDIEHILANVELAYAVTMYCKYRSNAINQNISDFIDYIKANKTDYKTLNVILGA